LNGEFSIVAYFKKERNWLCAVDHVGTKPLKFSLKDGFRVASSASALRELGMPLQIDWDVCLFSLHNACLPSGRTLFSHVHSIPPGHLIRVDAHLNFVQKAYSAEQSAQTGFSGSLGEQIEKAVMARVPRHFKPALALSSGVDSSLIASILKKYQVDFSCYSIDFMNSQFSERKEIEEFCQRQDLKTTFISVSEEDLIANFCTSIRYSENLVINPHSAGKLILNEFIAKSGHRICFTGDGADELFWGYEHFHTADEFQFVRNSNFIGSQFSSLLKPQYRAPLLEKNLFADIQKIDMKADAQRMYYHYWLSEYGLKILGDSQASSVSVELRHPFVDCSLLQYTRLIGSTRERNAPSKALLRKEMAGFDPKQAEIAKKPFTAPFITESWLPLFEKYLSFQTLEKLEIFDSDIVMEYISRLQQNRAKGEHRTSSVVLAQLLSLGILTEDLCHV
jgi:asparagine synthase (glutamine-hydrolysing)